MSCISKILEVKGDKEFIKDGEIAIEGGGIYKGFEYLITLTDKGIRCGYVAIPEDHHLYNFHNAEYNYPDLDVHGDVTYWDDSRFEYLINGHKCTDKWIGFDAGDAWDIPCIETAEKYFGETNYIKFCKNNPIFYYGEHAQHRTYKFMENECKKLIEQLI